MRKLSYLLGGLIISLALAAGARGQWPTNPEQPLIICNSLHDQYYQECHRFPNSNYLIIWVNDYNGMGDSYLKYQVLDQFGNSLLPFNGITVTESPYDTHMKWLVPTTNGELIVIFHDDRLTGDGKENVFAQRFDNQGNRLWGPDGVPVATMLGRELCVTDAVTDSAGGAFIAVVKNEYLVDEDNLYMQHLSVDGERLWGEQGILFRDTVEFGTNCQAIPDLQGGVIVAWEDYREGGFNFHLYLQHIDANGNCLWHWNGEPFMSIYGSQFSTYMAEAISDGEGGGVWFMEGISYPESYIIFLRLNYNGETLWETSDAGPFCWRQLRQMLSNSNDYQYWAIAEENRLVYPNPCNIFLYRFDVNGNFSFNNGLRIGNPSYTQQEPHMSVWDNGVVMSYIDKRGQYQDSSMVYSQKVDTVGNLLWNPPDGILTFLDTINYLGDIWPSPCSNGSNGIMVAAAIYQDTTYHDIYAQGVQYNGFLGGLYEIVLIIKWEGNNAILNWNSIPNNTGYNIFISDQPHNFSSSPDTTVTDTVYVDQNAVSEVHRFYRITYNY